jgi:signal transduction histidine kinase
MSRVAAEVAEFAHADIRQRGLALTMHLADDLPPVQGNSIDLQQVILNLILNGAQAMRDVVGGTREIGLETYVQEDNVVLAVKDHGCGFDETQTDQLFEPFFTTKTHGTGMGLAINRTIILAHGGRIWATSSEDGGATFFFCLPAVTESSV